MPIFRAAVHRASCTTSSASCSLPVMRMASRYTRSPYVSSNCSGAAGSPRRSLSTRAASRSTRASPDSFRPVEPLIVSACGMLIVALLCPRGRDMREALSRVEREVLLQLVHTAFHHLDVLRQLTHEDGTFQRGHDEVCRSLRVALGAEATGRLATAQRLRHGDAPRDEDLSQALPETLVDVGQLGGEVAHGTASDAVALALVIEDAIEQPVDLRHRIGSRIGERGLERAIEESPHQPIDD